MEIKLGEALALGVQSHRAGRLEEAERYYSAILKKTPKHPDANHNMGVIAVQVGKINQALPFFKRAVEEAPDIEQFWLSYIDGFIRLDLKEQALHSFNQAKKHFSNSKKLLLLEKRILEMVSKVPSLEMEEEPSEEKLREIADLMALGKHRVALTKALQLSNEFQKSFILSNILGTLYKACGELKCSIDSFKKAIQLKPDFFEAHYNMGNALKEYGKIDDALVAYNEAISLNPNFVQAHYNSAIVLNELGRFEESIEVSKKVISLKPDFEQAHYNLGNAFKEFGKLEDALVSYNEAISLKSNYAEVYNNIGIIRRDQGNIEEAIKTYRKAISLKPKFAEAYNNLANILKEKGDINGAIKAYLDALNIAPSFAEARRGLATLYFESGNFKDAAEHFKKCKTLKSQTSLLKCLYELNDQTSFYRQLDYLLDKGETNCVVGSLISRSGIRYGIKRNNPFCNEPLKYVLTSDLTEVCNFGRTFIDTVSNVLKDDRVQCRSQGLLKNGIQTSGNIFTQVGNLTDDIQDVIFSQLEKYRNHFEDSSEGFIQNWPENYSIEGWLVSMRRGGELAAHIHDKGWMTGSIYINVPPRTKDDDGNLVVSLDGAGQKISDKNNLRSINVVTGNICLFPASLMHYTIPFESNQDRIVLAFDMVPK